MSTSDARFYITPSATGILQTIDCGSNRVTALDDPPTFDREDAYDGARVPQSVFFGGGMDVHIQIADVNLMTSAGQDLERRLLSMMAHLGRGNSIGFSLVHTKAYLAFRSRIQTWAAGSTYVQHGGNAFGTWASLAALAAADPIVIESANPETYREYTTVSSVTLNKVTLTDSLWYEYGTAVENAVRYRYFWPVLRLPKRGLGRPVITTPQGRRTRFTFDATFEYDFGSLAAVTSATDYQGGLLPLASTTATAKSTGSGVLSIDQLITFGKVGGGVSAKKKSVNLKGLS